VGDGAGVVGADDDPAGICCPLKECVESEGGEHVRERAGGGTQPVKCRSERGVGLGLSEPQINEEEDECE